MEAQTYLDKPWLKSYKLGPYRLDHSLAPYPRRPLGAVLDEASQKYPGQTALLYLGRSIKYPQLRQLADRLANALAALGVAKGDRVCLYMPNCPEYIISDWAILKAGAVVVPTSILRTQEGLLHEVNSSQSRVLICQERHLERALAAREASALEHIIVTTNEGFDLATVQGTLPRSVHEFSRLLEAHDPQPPPVEIDPLEDLCELAFTGGATGTPKGVMITHANRLSCIQLGIPWLLKPVLRGFEGKASCLVGIPLFHTYGHYAAQSAMYMGLRLILIPDPRDTALIVQSIETYRPFLIPTVPTQLMRLAEAGLSRINALPMSGSAPLPVEVARAFKQQTGMSISEGYGLTETSPATHFNASAFARITGFAAKEKYGIGIPAPDTECRLVDPLSGADVPFGEAGELVLRGPQIMKGYWPEPGSGLDSEGWLHTGDIGVMDEDGYFQVVDRIKDMVNVSGLKVYTNKVDEVLFRHPAVFMAAAFGIPDLEKPGSERVMAVVQLRPGCQGQVSPEELRAYCREHLAPYEVPALIELREEIPLTVTEKVFKKALRDEAAVRLKLENRAEAQPGLQPALPAREE
jgi:long-chain acyl-CoA synthetase